MPLCTVLIYRVCVRVPLPVCEPVCVVCVLCVPVCVSCRKVCKNCLCPREEHDIREERDNSGRVSVGKILFSPDVDTLTRRSSEGLGSPKYVRLTTP